MPAERTALYRLFDEGDVLLYIGISNDPDGRWSQHQSTTPWIREVSTRTLEWHPSREDALAAESRTVRAERPRYNVVHRPGTATLEMQATAEEELRAVMAEYEAALPRALKARDEGIRRIASEYNLKQVDVIRITGYSRETVRQALNPKVRAAVKKAAEDRKAGKAEEG